MGSFSNYLEDELLDHIFGCGTTDYTPPADIYVALSTADPGEDGSTIAEPSGGSYARVQSDESDWGTSSGGTVSNTAELSFTTATGAWGAITHFALYDDPSAGNMLGYGSLTTPKTVGVGDTAKFAIGDLDITLT